MAQRGAVIRAVSGLWGLGWAGVVRGPLSRMGCQVWPTVTAKK